MTRRTINIAIFAQAVAQLWPTKSLPGNSSENYVVDMVCEIPSHMSDADFKLNYEHIIFPTDVLNSRLSELLFIGEILSVEEIHQKNQKVWRYVFRTKRAYEAWHEENIVSADKHAAKVSPEISKLFNFYERHNPLTKLV